MRNIAKKRERTELEMIITCGIFIFRSFKSFKLKKKSSTLGINKTSESPPMLRRDEDDPYNSNSSYRHTYNVGLGSNFDRGAAYRTSLQNINSNRVSECHLFYI